MTEPDRVNSLVNKFVEPILKHNKNIAGKDVLEKTLHVYGEAKKKGVDYKELDSYDAKACSSLAFQTFDNIVELFMKMDCGSLATDLGIDVIRGKNKIFFTLCMQGKFNRAEGCTYSPQPDEKVIEKVQSDIAMYIWECEMCKLDILSLGTCDDVVEMMMRAYEMAVENLGNNLIIDRFLDPTLNDEMIPFSSAPLSSTLPLTETIDAMVYLASCKPGINMQDLVVLVSGGYMYGVTAEQDAVSRANGYNGCDRTCFRRENKDGCTTYRGMFDGVMGGIPVFEIPGLAQSVLGAVDGAATGVSPTKDQNDIAIVVDRKSLRLLLAEGCDADLKIWTPENDPTCLKFRSTMMADAVVLRPECVIYNVAKPVNFTV